MKILCNTHSLFYFTFNFRCLLGLGIRVAVVTKNGWLMGEMWAVYWANTKKKIHNVPEIPSYVHHSCQLAFTKANEDKTKQRIKGC